MRRLLIVLFLVFLASCDSRDAQLESTVRAGGVTLYMRQAATEASQDDWSGGRKSFADCSWQRGLSDAGRAQAKQVAKALPRIGLAIHSVTASPMCRTMETATLAFGRAEPALDLRGRKGADGGTDVSPVVAYFKRVVPPGAVAIVVGHEHPGLGFKPMLKEGESAVLRGTGDSYEELGRIPLERWAQWARK